MSDQGSTDQRGGGAGVIDRRAKIGALIALAIGGLCIAIALAWEALR